MKIPSEIIIGDSLNWNDDPTQDNLGNIISSPDWELKYILNGPTKLTITSTAKNGGGWSSTIPAVDSTNLSSGTYYWQAFATKGDERVTIGQGQIKVNPNLFTENANFDGRSQTKKDLDNVQLAIRALVSNGAVQEYKIGNRELKKMSLGELRSYETQLKFQLNKEERAAKIQNGLGDPMTLKIRFK